MINPSFPLNGRRSLSIVLYIIALCRCLADLLLLVTAASCHSNCIFRFRTQDPFGSQPID